MNKLGIGYAPESSIWGENSVATLLLELAAKGVQAVPLGNLGHITLDPLRRSRFNTILAAAHASQATEGHHSTTPLAFPVLHTLGDRLSLPPSVTATPGTPNIGLARLNHLDIPAVNLQCLIDWPLILAETNWAARTLREKGLTNVIALPPGIDATHFHPGPRAGLFPGYFVVFSGGPLDDSAGLDTLLAAFRVFRQRHPNALLAYYWRLKQPPQPTDGNTQATAWLVRHGIPPEATIDCSAASMEQLPQVLRECDLAAFPVRCAGDGGPLALAAMACGVPTVLAGNTGHLDLIGDHAYILQDQVDHAPTSHLTQTGWGECSVEELIATMERAYDQRGEAAQKGKAAAQFAKERTEARRVEILLTAINSAAQGRVLPAPALQEEYAWGLALHRAQQLAAAEQIYTGILQREPGYIAALGDRANARRDQGNMTGAEADFRQILEAHPHHARAWRSLGNLLRMEGRLTEAATCLHRSLTHHATPKTQWDFAYTLLLMGRYADAWPHFEHRHAALGLRTPSSSKPRWDGRPMPHGTLLVVDEQGLGDTLQFLRFLPLIPAQESRIIFAGKPPTLPVAQRFLPNATMADWNGPLPTSDAWVPLMSLPERLGVTRPEELPAPLTAKAPLVEAERAARWRPQVRGTDNQPVVGLCWRGNRYFSNDAQRSPGLAALQPLLAVEGARFIALQVGYGRQEITDLDLHDRLIDIGGEIEAAGQEILDTLAALQSCDLVISSCTSLVHMAGLMGRPGWVLLNAHPDWRWMTQRTDTPWYPSLQLIRQDTPGDWASVATVTAQRLQQWVQAYTRHF